MTGFVGLILATIIRLELAYPGQCFLTQNAERYLTLISVHGIVMVFFVVIPLLFGAFANFLLPTQLGVRDVAFPRLNSFMFWLTPSGFVLLIHIILFDRSYTVTQWLNYGELKAQLRRRNNESQQVTTRLPDVVADSALAWRLANPSAEVTATRGHLLSEVAPALEGFAGSSLEFKSSPLISAVPSQVSFWDLWGSFLSNITIFYACDLTALPFSTLLSIVELDTTDSLVGGRFLSATSSLLFGFPNLLFSPLYLLTVIEEFVSSLQTSLVLFDLCWPYHFLELMLESSFLTQACQVVSDADWNIFIFDLFWPFHLIFMLLGRFLNPELTLPFFEFFGLSQTWLLPRDSGLTLATCLFSFCCRFFNFFAKAALEPIEFYRTLYHLMPSSTAFAIPAQQLYAGWVYASPLSVAELWADIYIILFESFRSYLFGLYRLLSATLCGSPLTVAFVPFFTPLYVALVGLSELFDSILSFFFFLVAGNELRGIADSDIASLFSFNIISIYFFFRTLYYMHFELSDVRLYCYTLFDHIFVLWEPFVATSLLCFSFDLFFVLLEDIVALAFID